MTNPGLRKQPTNQVEMRYRNQVIKRYNTLSLTGLPERSHGLNEVTLEHIFVKLNVTIQQSMVFGREIGHLRLEEELRQRQRSSRADDLRMMAELHRLESEAAQPKIISLSIAEALHQHQRLIILGGPGSGKTTLTRWLAVVFADQRQGQPETLGAHFIAPRLPILIELRRFAERYSRLGKEPVVPDLVTEVTNFISNNADYPKTPPKFIRQALADGRCLLLFDGLDEIADLGARQLLIQSIRAFLNHPQHAYGANLCLVTSRPYGYQSVSLGASFQESEVKPFAPEDVKLFVTYWCDTAYGDPAEAQTLLTAIEQNPSVAALATNPLLCTIVALIYRNNRVLPNRRVELYLKCCEALLDTWENVKAIKDSGLIGGYDWQLKIDLLAPVAYWLHSERERLAATEDEFVRQLATVLQEKKLADGVRATQEARDFIAMIRDRSGLIQGRGDGMLEFMHRTFQEYLAARYIAAQPDPDYIDLVLEHLHEAWWQEVHLLVIGYLGSSSVTVAKTTQLLHTILHIYRPPLFLLRSFSLDLSPPSRLRDLLGDYKDHFLHWPLRAIVWLYLIPFRVRMGFAHLFPSWQLDRRLACLLHCEYELVVRGYLDCTPVGVEMEFGRRLAHRVLQSLVQEVYDPVVSFIDVTLPVPQRFLYQIAPGSNTLYNSNGLLPRLLVRIDADATPYVDVLIAALTDGDGNVRHRAVRALMQLGQATPAVVEGLLHALIDSEELVRKSAAVALGRLDQATHIVIESLLRALIDAEENMRRSYLFALFEYSAQSYSLVAQFLTFLLQSEMRNHAAAALGQLGQAKPTITERLLHALTDPNENVRSSAILVLGQLGQTTSAVFDGLLHALDDADWYVRYNAAKALGWLGQATPNVVEKLIDTLADTNGAVRNIVVETLIRLGQVAPIAVDTWLAALTNADELVRIDAQFELIRLGQDTPAVIDGLLHALAAPDESVRYSAALALGGLGQTAPAVVDVLLQALAASDKNVRSDAVKALGGLGQATPAVIDGLLHVLADPDDSARYSAAVALGKLGQASPAVIDSLLHALAAPARDVRSAAADALGQLGETTPTVVDRLLYALTDTEQNVRSAAAEALGQLGQTSPTVVKVLFATLTTAEGNLRRSAAVILGRLGQISPAVVKILLIALADSDKSVRRSAVEVLGKLQIEDKGDYQQLLRQLNRCLHSVDDDKRKDALDTIRTLINGRPLPGYHWVPLHQRMEQRRRMYAITHWTILLIGIIMVAFGLSYLDANTRLMQVITVLGGLIGIAAGLAQVVGKALRNPWEKDGS